MEDAPIKKVLNDALRDALGTWINNGLSDEEIIQKLEKINFEEIMLSVADTASSNFTTLFSDRMYEIELTERAKAQEFLTRQEQLWGKCFAASQTLYTITGVNPRVVQQRLGHSDVNITLNTYTHVLPAMDVEAAEKLDAMLLKRRED